MELRRDHRFKVVQYHVRKFLYVRKQRFYITLQEIFHTGISMLNELLLQHFSERFLFHVLHENAHHWACFTRNP